VTSSLAHFLDNRLTDGGESKDEAIPATGRRGPHGCEASYFLVNRLTDNGEVVSLTSRPTALRSVVRSFDH
jgi:hypothetical protein